MPKSLFAVVIIVEMTVLTDLAPVAAGPVVAAVGPASVVVGAVVAAAVAPAGVAEAVALAAAVVAVAAAVLAAAVAEVVAAATHVHRLLQALLNLDSPTYHHHLLLTDETGRRYAKRDKSVTLQSLRADGKTLEDVMAMAKLG